MEKENLEKSEELNIKDEDSRNEEKISFEKKKSPIKKALKVFLVAVLALFVWFAAVQYIAADKYVATVQVKSEGSATGVNPRSEKLDYGDVPKNSSMIRSITVKNGGNADVYIKILKHGDIAEIIEIEKSDFTLQNGQEENIEFLLDVPISAEEREYKGGIIILKIPKIF